MKKLIADLREKSKKGRDPTCADETLEMLLRAAQTRITGRYLEIGAAECLTSITIALETAFEVVAIEKDPMRCARAFEYIHMFDLDRRIRLYEGDAGNILPCLNGTFDIIFLDGPKAQYLRYLPECKRLLRSGGLLFSDDVLLYGWVNGEPPAKRRALIEHIREYLTALNADGDFTTEIYEYGEGLAVSKKK